jgi:hypothetical protein
MPPGDGTAPEAREAQLDQLRALLGDVTLQVLRQAARRWNWPVRGTAKADIVEQLLQQLTDEAQMRRIVQSLPPEQREALAWLGIMARDSGTLGRIQAAMNAGSGSNLSLEDIRALLASLAGGCVIFDRGNGVYQIPAAYAAWQPLVEAPQLRRAAPPAATRLVTRTDLLQQADVLLTAIEVEQPLAQTPAPVFAGQKFRQRQEDYAPPPSLVAPELLTRWGFGLADDLHLARFLLELLINSGVLQTERITNQRLRLRPGPLRANWDRADAVARLGFLRVVAFSRNTDAERSFGSWNELCLALPDIEGFALRTLYYYGDVTPGQIALVTNAMRADVFTLLAGLQTDCWYDMDRLDTLFYQTTRDPFRQGQQVSLYLRWHAGIKPLDPHQIDQQIWRKTYGHALRAVLRGPAYWLQLVELGIDGGQVVAVRVPATEVVGEAQAAPPDAMGFAENEYLLIRTSRWMGDLRRLALLIATEAAQRSDVRVFKLAPAAVRATLQRGLSLDDVAEHFAAAGFPLPQAMVEQLQTWQSRAGRHHLYDNLAVIELSEDVLLAEIQAIAHLLDIPVYQASPRCLLVLDPTAVPTLTAELVRRGYTPKVLS